MKIGFDRQIFRRQRVGGISRYFNELVTNIKAEGIQVASSGNRKYWNDSDIVHATFYGGKPYNLKKGQRLVSSLFDMTPEKYPEYFAFSKFRSPHENKFKWLHKSDLIISISDASSDDLIFLDPTIKTKIKRIHLSTSINLETPSPIRELEDSSFLLMVGKRYSYKNGLTLLRALSLLRRKSQPQNCTGQGCNTPMLVLAGGGPLTRRERYLITQNRLEKHIVHISADDHQLAWLYRNTKGCLIPSIAEGFSLPLIECLVLNTPIVASDIEAHREVASDFAYFVPALNAQDWSDQMSIDKLKKPKEILGEAKYILRCDYYSSKRLARDHIESYMQLINI